MTLTGGHSHAIYTAMLYLADRHCILGINRVRLNEELLEAITPQLIPAAM